RFNAEVSGRPMLVKGNRQRLFGGMGRLTESSVVSIKNKPHAVTAEVVVPDAGAEGVIIAQGGSIGGWSLYAKDGRPKYCYNLLGVQRFYVEGDKAIPAGQHQVRMEFAYDGGGLGKGGEVRLFVDGERVGEGRVGATAAMIFSADDTCDVGMEGGAVVSEDYGPRGNEFTGEVNWVQIDLDEAAEDLDHLITPEERLHIAMARQ
ncbi:MAG TPA: arylsulfatase, partial [Actinomycetota bacterium]|nr:arylsulfatase [Actinomycetota bacterium]